MTATDPLALAFDGLLAVITVALGIMSVFARQLITAISSFIALGLALAICWARLGALDVALAEVILGAGVLGGLMLRAWSGYAAADPSDGEVAPGTHGVVVPVLVALVALALAAAVAAVGQLSEGSAAMLPDAFAERMGATGVTHPVTAILLDFRALDTLLELAVLLVAAIAALAVGRTDLVAQVPSPPLASLLRVVVPLLIITGGVLLWRGAFAPGGAFQAGACLGAAAILVLLGWRQVPLGGAAAYGMLTLGVAVFSVLGAGAMLLDGALLDWPDAHAGAIILGVEAAATVSIAVGLTLLFAGGATWRTGAPPA